MPIYEYECSKCNRVLEKIIKFNEQHPTKCDCSMGGTLSRIISLPSAPKFKGSGFYKTDYGTNKKRRN